MKKWISFGLSLVLIVASIFFAIDAGAVSAGAGNGQGKSVRSVEELSDVMEWIGQNFGAQYAESALSGGGSNVAFGDDDESFSDNNSGFGGDEEIERTKYTSVTLQFKTVYGLDTNSSYSGDRSTESMSMQREMTCYFTTKACYYDIDATIRNRSSSEIGTVNSAVRIKAQMFVNKKKFLMRFEEFSVLNRYNYEDEEMMEEVEDEETRNFEPMLYKWLDCSEVGGGVLLGMISEVTEENFEIMSILGSYMQTDEEDGKRFSKSGSVYNLKSSYVKSLCSTLLDMPDKAIDKDSSFVVDLSANKAPKMMLDMLIDYDENHDYPNGSYHVSAKGAENLYCCISNINNTVVSAPNAKTYDLEDFKYLFE